MGTAYEAAMRGGEGGILLFTFLLCIIVVSSYDSWYAASPVRRGFQWHSRLFSRFRRDANDGQQGRSLYQKWRGLDTRSDQFQRLKTWWRFSAFDEARWRFSAFDETRWGFSDAYET